jgi:endonuclease VIII
VPEGDTVWLAAQRMHEALVGRQLTRSDFRVPSLATTDLSGRAVLEVVPRGKHMLTRLEGGLSLHTHFRMDGSWHLYRPGDRWTGGPAWQVRVVLENAAWQAVGYRLPVVELLATDDEASAVGHLGPDVLADDWDLDEAVRRLRDDPAREVGMALLDQRNLAGLGNLYRTEVLFVRGLTPWTAVGDVPDLPALVEKGRRLMLANRGHWEQSTTGSLRQGETHWVFERSGRPGSGGTSS